MTDDVLKCQLKPLDRSEYSVTFSDDQWARLEAVFSGGVCDYSKPGVGQQPPPGPWQTYAAGPDGVPLGPAPASTAVMSEGTASESDLPATGAGLAAMATVFVLTAGGRRRPRD